MTESQWVGACRLDGSLRCVVALGKHRKRLLACAACDRIRQHLINHNSRWLLSITEALREFEGWGLGISNIPDSYILIFGNRLLVKGQLAKCATPAEVVEETRRLLNRGDKKWWQFWR